MATTVVDALARLPKDSDRGFRFRALDGTEHRYSWRELEVEATRRARLLMGLGLVQGDRVALVLAEPHQFVLTFLGALLGGIVPVPIYPRAGFKAKNAYFDTVVHIVRASGARALVTLAATRSVIDEVVQAGAKLEQVVVLEELLQESTGDVPLATISEDDLCFLQFTSGSTSLPKGVMVTHRSVVANALAFLGPHGAKRRDDDVALTWLPLFHDMGLIGFVLGTMMTDVPTVLLPTESFARRPTMWMQAMSKYKASTFRDGWLHTGDLGYVADGNLYVCGRLKDLIIIRGANYHPQDIEWAVAELPGVRRDNVVAFSALRADEEVLIVAAEGASTDAPELRKAIASRVTEACGVAPAHVAIVRVGSLPKTSSGKIQRRRTKQMHEEGLLEEQLA